MTMIPPIAAEHTRIDHRELSVRAAGQYQVMRAARDANERRRAEKRAAHSTSHRWYLRPFLRHAAATRP